MKFSLTVLAVLAMASPLYAYKIPSTGSGELAKDFQEILDLIPLEEIVDITRTYAAQDKQFQLMMNLVKSADSKEYVLFVEQAAVVKKMLAYMQNNGIDMYYLLNQYNKLLGLPPFKPLAGPQREITGGVSGYVSDIAAVVPVDKLLDVLNRKKEANGAFNGLINQILTSEFLDFYNSMLQNKIYLRLADRAEQIGVDRDSFLTYYQVYLIMLPFNK